MTLTLQPSQVLAIRHAYVRGLEDRGLYGIHADSSDDEILRYTSLQSIVPRRFPASPPREWAVFIPDGGDRARL